MEVIMGSRRRSKSNSSSSNKKVRRVCTETKASKSSRNFWGRYGKAVVSGYPASRHFVNQADKRNKDRVNKELVKCMTGKKYNKSIVRPGAW